MLLPRERQSQHSLTQAIAGSGYRGDTLLRVRNELAMNLSLRFDAIKDQVWLLDERCADPALTSFILAIDALAQRGFDECVRHTHSETVGFR